MAYVPVSRAVTQKFGGVIELRMAVNKAVSGQRVSQGHSRFSVWCPPFCVCSVLCCIAWVVSFYLFIFNQIIGVFLAYELY